MGKEREELLYLQTSTGNRLPQKINCQSVHESETKKKQPNQRKKPQTGREERDKFNDRRKVQVLTVENR